MAVLPNVLGLPPPTIRVSLIIFPKLDSDVLHPAVHIFKGFFALRMLKIHYTD
jgi:hypothetical protein